MQVILRKDFMARLTLEKVMQKSFIDIGDTSSDVAFHEFNESIGKLAEANTLREEDIRELIDPDLDMSDVIDKTAQLALSETITIDTAEVSLYLPGYTAVVVDSRGRILGVKEDPNVIPKLQSYGPSLMWAMRKLGHERYSTTRTGSTASELLGYSAVNVVLNGSHITNISYGNRHHIGGASSWLERDDLRSNTRLHAGVSGVVATDTFRNHLATVDDRIRSIASEALLNNQEYLDDFTGNMFAGSLDSTLGAFILEEVAGYDTKGLFTETALMSIARRHADGINVH